MKAPYVYDIEEIPDQDDCQLGVVVSRSGRQQLHCGLAFDINKSLKIIHMANFKDVEFKEDWGDFKVFIKTSLDTFNQELLLPYFDAVFQSIAEGKTKIPYAFGYEDFATITPKGEVNFGVNGIGLTCSTFVLSLFHTNGYDVVDLEHWDPREEDKHWQIKILNYFYDNRGFYRISMNFLQKMWEQFGCPRFRPEETAVSTALYNDGPAETQKIWDEGKELRDYIFDKE